MIENHTQLDADTQHQVETFGPIEPVPELWKLVDGKWVPVNG